MPAKRSVPQKLTLHIEEARFCTCSGAFALAVEVLDRLGRSRWNSVALCQNADYGCPDISGNLFSVHSRSKGCDFVAPLTGTDQAGCCRRFELVSCQEEQTCLARCAQQTMTHVTPSWRMRLVKHTAHSNRQSSSLQVCGPGCRTMVRIVWFMLSLARFKLMCKVGTVSPRLWCF